MLPNFIVIGAGKSGTSSIYLWLRQHPDIFMPAALKETLFFAFNPGLAEHRALAGTDRFPITTIDEYAALFEDAGGATAVGEATPRYLDSYRAPEHMSAVIPQAKLIVSIREPTARVVSHAQMNIRHGDATDLEAEVRRLASTDEHLYAPKFQRWLSFFPRERFLIMRYDDVFARPQDAVKRMFNFLSVDDSIHVQTDVVHNPGGVPRSMTVQRMIDLRVLRRLRPLAPAATYNAVARLRRWNSKSASELPADLTQQLRERYAQDIEATTALLDLDLSGWLA